MEEAETGRGQRVAGSDVFRICDHPAKSIWLLLRLRDSAVSLRASASPSSDSDPSRMRLIVFGATGNCGRHFVKLAAAHGHSVTAVVRDGSRADASATVTVVQGDVLDPSFVANSLRGQDAVMSGLGMRYRHPWSARESPDDFISRATAHIVDGMRAAGVARISAISAGGIGDSRPMLNLLVRFLVATSNVGVAYADLERVEQILRASGLNWQAVRPAHLTQKSATGRARQTSRYPATATIPREVVAAFMLEELERPQFSARTPMITVT